MSLALIAGSALMIACVGIVGYVYYCYATAPAVTDDGKPATTMDRLAYATKKSEALFVQLVTAFFVMLGNGVMSLGDFFNAPELRDWIKQMLTPELASGVIVFLIFLTCAARLRGMGNPFKG